MRFLPEHPGICVPLIRLLLLLQSTLFNAMCKNGKAQAANFPFCTIEPNVGVVAVPDERLQVLTDLSKSKETVSTAVEFVDIAGLVKGASKGEGLGNQFLANIRECDSIVQVGPCQTAAPYMNFARHQHMSFVDGNPANSLGCGKRTCLQTYTLFLILYAPHS